MYNTNKLKIGFFVLIFILVLTPSVKADTWSWCFQESANVSTECGGLDTGTYEEYNSNPTVGNWTNFSNTIDGDWDTYGYKSGIGAFSVYLYINYTKPQSALNTSLWQVKDNGGIDNLTIPISCWNYDNTKLIFMVESYSVRGDADGIWSCYNGTNWLEIRLSPYYTQIYEEAMWWNITDTTPPTYSDNSTNSTHAGQDILHSLKWTDVVGLSGYIFSFDNGTGTLVNNTWTAMTGTTNWSNVTKIVNSTVGATIRWCVYANDTSGNWNNTGCDTPFSYVTTELPPPPITTFRNWLFFPDGFAKVRHWAITLSDNNVIRRWRMQQ